MLPDEVLDHNEPEHETSPKQSRHDAVVKDEQSQKTCA